MKNIKPRIIVIMPAYNAEKTLRLSYNDLPKGIVDMVILTDDASTDRTVEIAKELGIKVFQHTRNMGYGANQKTCYKEALKERADIIVMLHPDYQYDPTLLPDIVQPIIDGKADVVLGSRILGGNVLKRGMPLWKYIPNRVLTILENRILNLNLSEYHTGYRAFSSAVLRSVNYQVDSDKFLFDSEILFQIKEKGFRIKEVPAPIRYFKESRSASFSNSVRYGFGVLWLLIKYKLYKLGIVRSSLFV
jgi:glycosyltransferase involved in cell wall biosynthesis